MSRAKEFIEAYIVKRSNELPAEVRNAFKPEQTIEMNLSGPEGGVFTLAWSSGALSAKEGKATAPMVRMATSAKAFLDLMTGKYSEAVDFTKLGNLGQSSQFMMDPLSLMQPAKLDIVKKLSGTLAIQYCDGPTPNDDVLSETFLSFNNEPIDQDDPRCTVLMPIGKLERIAKGEVTPPQLMMAGGMRVIGDMQMVIQMSPLLRA